MKTIIIILVSFVILGCGENVTGQYSDTDTENYSTDTTSTSDEVTDTDTISLPEDSDTFDMEAYSAQFDCLAGKTPEDLCLNGNVINFTGEYTIIDGKCNFSFETEACGNDGCVAGNVNDPYAHCYDECDTPEWIAIIEEERKTKEYYHCEGNQILTTGPYCKTIDNDPTTEGSQAVYEITNCPNGCTQISDTEAKCNP